MSFKFSSIAVTKQVFYSTPLSFAIVNVRPVLPGHVLVCPRRVIDRFTELRADEVADLFATVQLVSRAVERFYDGKALNIAIQDGPIAGQSIPHVHCHVIPRRVKDLKHADELYQLLNEHDLSDVFHDARSIAMKGEELVPDSSRRTRSMDDMAAEAMKLREFIAKHHEELASADYKSPRLSDP